MGVTVHWINESTIERQSATLACSRFKGAHTYTKVAEILSSIHRKFIISRSTIIATVTDNGANFAKSFKEFGVIIPVVDNVGIDEDTASGETDINDEPNEDDAEFYNSCLEVDEDYLIEQPLTNHLRCASHILTLTCTTDARTGLKGSFSKLYHSVFASVQLFGIYQDVLNLLKQLTIYFNVSKDCHVQQDGTACMTAFFF
ncbi:UNVERIFIED_CONTAM: hypothetical protein RMT77_014407 [Armadillidium vulgare]